MNVEIEVLESKKHRLKFKLKGETHTFCNILTDELWDDKATKVAGYNLKEGLETEPIFIVETENKDPKKILEDAIQRLKKKVKELDTNLAKIVK